MVVHMSHIWCHGTRCHTNHTTDRVRGSKGSKVLRTRKVKQTAWNRKTFYKYFCSNSCYNDFANANIERIRLVAPRIEALETPIDDPTKIKHTTSWGHTYYDHTIKEKGVDTQSE
jgi:YHS domain-containing protein